MSDPDESLQRNARRPGHGVPWLALAALAISLFLFWVLPLVLGDHPVQVEFTTQESKQR